MSHSTATARRRMQFCAGPERETFYACAEHRPELDHGNVSCFLVIAGETVEELTAEDAEEESCWFCREG